MKKIKNKVYLELLRKYNYQNKETIQLFIDNASNLLSSDLFRSNEIGQNTEMVGVKNIIKDPRKLNKKIILMKFTALLASTRFIEIIYYTAMKFITVALVHV